VGWAQVCLDALTQPEKRQDRQDDYDETDEVDNVIHAHLLSVDLQTKPAHSAIHLTPTLPVYGPQQTTQAGLRTPSVRAPRTCAQASPTSPRTDDPLSG
jgi:hypothetical protein